MVEDIAIEGARLAPLVCMNLVQNCCRLPWHHRCAREPQGQPRRNCSRSLQMVRTESIQCYQQARTTVIHIGPRPSNDRVVERFS